MNKRGKVVASIEARMGSSRLPGKVLMDIQGKSALDRLVSRLELSRKIDDIILATSTNSSDDILYDWAIERNIPVYRGSEHDVLDRVVNSHREMNTDIIVEITGDCPLLDPEVIDLGVETFLSNDCDVVNNVRKPSFPQGADIQVFKFNLLEKVSNEIFDSAVREHVSLYFYENPDIYKIIHLIAPDSLKHPDLRLQLDYKEDLDFIREVYKNLEPQYGDKFGVKEIIDLISLKPDIAELNKDCEEKPIR